jgi:hypothetical protein
MIFFERLNKNEKNENQRGDPNRKLYKKKLKN